MDLLERMQKLKEQQEIKSQEEISPEEVKKIPKKIEIKKISPEVRLIEDEIDILTKSIELAPKKLTIGFKPLISIRKLMAVREMFNLKAPKPVNKENLSKLLIKALKTV